MFFPALAFLLYACSSKAPVVKYDNTMIYQTMIQPRTVPWQNIYNSKARSGIFQKPVELEPAVEF